MEITMYKKYINYTSDPVIEYIKLKKSYPYNIQKRGHTYSVRIQGQRYTIPRCASDKETIEELEKLIISALHRIKCEKLGMVSNSISFDEICDKYIKDYSEVKKEWRSTNKDKYTISNFKRLLPYVKYSKHFNVESVNEFKDLRVKEVQPVTVNRELGSLRSMLGWAMKKRLIEKEDVSEVEFLPEPRNVDKVAFDKRHVDFIINFKVHPYKTAFYIMAALGLRPGEACNLPVANIDMDKRLIHIQANGNWKPKNATSKRILPIADDNLYKYLKTVLKRNKGVYLCSYEDGRQMTESVLASMVRKFKIEIQEKHKGYDFSGFRAKELRHYHATRLKVQGARQSIISLSMGHSNEDITQRIYDHSNREVEAMRSELEKVRLGY
jgi:integrase